MQHFVHFGTLLMCLFVIRCILLRLLACTTFRISYIPCRPYLVGLEQLCVVLAIAIPCLSVLVLEISLEASVFLVCLSGLFLLTVRLGRVLDIREYGLFFGQLHVPWSQIRDVRIVKQFPSQTLLRIHAQWMLPIQVWIPDERKSVALGLMRSAARYEGRSFTSQAAKWLVEVVLLGAIWVGLFYLVPR